jgi:hypothetical protein
MTIEPLFRIPFTVYFVALDRRNYLFCLVKKEFLPNNDRVYGWRIV